MSATVRSLTIAALLVAGAMMGWWVLRQPAPPTPVRRPAPPPIESTAGGVPDDMPRQTPEVSSPAFRNRLAQAEAVANPTQRRLARATILAEWLSDDYPAAFSFLQTEKFASLSLPGIAALVAARADTHQLLAIANESDLTFDAVRAVGAALAPDRFNAFVAAVGNVSLGKQADVAAAIAITLADRNLDAALAFAGTVRDPASQASAYAAIVDGLTAKRATTDALALVESLPDSIRDHDAIRFAYGNALTDAAPDQALASYAAITDPQTRRLAMVGFSRTIESRAPAVALQAIFDADLSADGTLNHATRILQNWSALDPAAAREFVATASWLTDEQRRQLSAGPAPP